jgi:methyltransferase
VSPSHIILSAVTLQRLVELAISRRNTARLIAAGGVEVGRRHYPALVALHAAWLAALWLLVPGDAVIIWPFLGLFLLLQLGRLWVLRHLGAYWTTRIITLPGAPLVTGGPYRYCRHPNYLVVAGEIAVLPLALGAWPVALIFSLLNAAVLAGRIRVEDAALTTRRRHGAQ